MISNLHSSKNAPAYKSMAANEGITKAIASFFRDDSDTVFLSIYVPIIYSEGINFDWHNGWKCWTLASKTFERRRATQDFKNGGPLEMLTIAKLIKN